MRFSRNDRELPHVPTFEPPRNITAHVAACGNVETSRRMIRSMPRESPRRIKRHRRSTASRDEFLHGRQSDQSGQGQQLNEKAYLPQRTRRGIYPVAAGTFDHDGRQYEQKQSGEAHDLQESAALEML